MKKLFLLIATCLLSTSAFCQALWQKSQSNMTVSQVEKIYPNAVPPLKESTFSNGGKIKLVIPNYQVGGIPYDVEFVFKDDKLEFVRLSSKEPSPKLAFDTSKELLTTKYGQPYNNQITSISQDVMWKDKGTLIKLSNIMGIVIITYWDESQSDANKL